MKHRLFNVTIYLTVGVPEDLHGERAVQEAREYACDLLRDCLGEYVETADVNATDEYEEWYDE